MADYQQAKYCGVGNGTDALEIAISSLICQRAEKLLCQQTVLSQVPKRFLAQVIKLFAMLARMTTL